MFAMRVLLAIVVSTFIAQAPPALAVGAEQPTQVKKVEQWWRIKLLEYDQGQWRSAGTFENQDYDRCIRYGQAWVEGRPKYRSYTPPFGFRQ